MGGWISGTEVDVGLSGFGGGQRVVVEVVVRVRVVAGEVGRSSAWGWGRAVVVGGRSEARRKRRLREEKIASRDIGVLSC